MTFPMFFFAYNHNVEFCVGQDMGPDVWSENNSPHTMHLSTPNSSEKVRDKIREM